MAQPEPSVLEQIDDAAEARALDEAEAAYAAGRVISHEAMVRWLNSSGDAERIAAASAWRIVWTEPARTDLESIQAHIGQFDPLAAQRTALRIIAATENVVGLFAHAGRSIGGGRHEFPLSGPMRCDTGSKATRWLSFASAMARAKLRT